MQRRDKFVQVPPQKIERHLDGEKLVPLVGRPRGGKFLFAAPVKAGGQRRKHGLGFVAVDTALAFEIQADLDAAGMKTFAPVKFRVRLEVVPLEAHARAAHTAVEMPPALANRAPHRAFGERGRDGGVTGFAIYNRSLGRFRHGDNVPVFSLRANFLCCKSPTTFRNPSLR